MIYVCSDCKKEIKSLETAGAGVNYNFVCPACGAVLAEQWAREKARLLAIEFGDFTKDDQGRQVEFIDLEGLEGGC